MATSLKLGIPRHGPRRRRSGSTSASYDRRFGRLRISRRRQQIESAKAGNTAMLIWQGKQLLGQVDKREISEEATVTQKTATLELTPEDEEFLRRKASLAKSIQM